MQMHRRTRRYSLPLSGSGEGAAESTKACEKRRPERKRARGERGMEVLSSVFPSHSLPRGLGSGFLLYPQCQGPSGRQESTMLRLSIKRNLQIYMTAASALSSSSAQCAAVVMFLSSCPPAFVSKLLILNADHTFSVKAAFP